MATYFHGSSETQAAAAAAPEGLQTLYLMNPNNYVPYSSDTPQQPQNHNMLFFNPATLAHAPPPHNEHFVGIPLPHPTTTVRSTYSEDPSRLSLHEISELHPIPPRIYYNLWGSVDQTGATNSGGGAAVEAASLMGFRRQGGLSLSLSPKQIRPPSQLPEISARDEIGVSGNSSSPVSTGVSKRSSNLGLKYLKAVQELLDEVVNVDLVEGNKQKAMVNREASSAAGEGSSGWDYGGGGGGKCGVELTAAQRQEVQMKKLKLTKMLDEVVQRYKQYHHQMQFVVASFEQAAGLNSAKSYTALALQTISKQFRCLKDAISAQIKSVNRSLGEETVLGAKVEGSRLRYVDHRLRQQRTLQQLGMPAQHSAWRPQRGLPEQSVSVLRAWLFEHFLHPYPKDSDKIMLAKQTGLTRSQVSNWFINARVRLWKPMVEEMYSEEIKDQEPNGSVLNNTNKTNPNKDMASNSTALQDSSAITLDQIKSLRRNLDKSTNQNTSQTEISNSTMSTSAMGASLQAHQSSFNLIRPSNIEGIAQKSPKKRRSPDVQNSPISILSMEMDTKHGDQTNHVGGGGFGAYQAGDMGQLPPRFHGNGVSLTLGLPQLSGTHQSYISNRNIEFGRRFEMGISGEPDFCGINGPTI